MVVRHEKRLLSRVSRLAFLWQRRPKPNQKQQGAFDKNQIFCSAPIYDALHIEVARAALLIAGPALTHPTIGICGSTGRSCIVRVSGSYP